MIEVDSDIKTISVLVVEDIALNQLLMKTILDDLGFDRDIAVNGKVALEMINNKSYDIILMDLQMPEMNGFEAADYIRNTLLSKIPIIALSADITTEDLEKCNAIGINDYISKPVDEHILHSKIIGLVKKSAIINSKKNKENKEEKKTKCIDLTYLTTRTKGNPELMLEMISLYLDQTPPLLDILKKSEQNKDWDSLYAAAHKLIPSFSIFGISGEIENRAKKIQELARSKIQTDALPTLIAQVDRICRQACTELQNEYQTMKNNTK